VLLNGVSIAIKSLTLKAGNLSGSEFGFHAFGLVFAYDDY